MPILIFKKTRELETNPFEFNWYPFDHATYISEDPTPGDWLTQAPQRVDMDQLIKFAAAENFTDNQDGTLNKGNNFYYYDWATNPNDANLMDPNYKQPRMYFPWDMDTCFKNANTSIIDDRGGHFIAGLIMEEDESGTHYGYDTFQADYYSTYRTLLDGPLSKANALAMITTIETAIFDDVNDDPHRIVMTDVNGNPLTAAADFTYVRNFVQNRWDYIDEQLDLLGPLPGTFLLNDGFEGTTWDANWTGPTWSEENTTTHSGSASAKAVDRTSTTLTCKSLDASDANAIYIYASGLGKMTWM